MEKHDIKKVARALALRGKRLAENVNKRNIGGGKNSGRSRKINVGWPNA